LTLPQIGLAAHLFLLGASLLAASRLHQRLLAVLSGVGAAFAAVLIYTQAVTIGKYCAYCMAIEALAGIEVPLYAQVLRGIALELERLSNHVGDLGALSNDIGYQPGASWFGRLRGEYLNLLLELSGNRFGRGLVTPGGIRFGISPGQRGDFLARLAGAERDLRDTAHVTFQSPSVGSRFEHTGVVTREVAEALGLVGPVARASGCDRDVRRDHPFGIFRFAHIPVALAGSGDVMARALVRSLETQRSNTFLREQLNELPEESLASGVPALAPESIAVSMVESWRGEIVHVAGTSADGRLAGYKIVDPSFHNWLGLAIAMRGTTADSLNASAAAAVLLFEAVRQRTS